MFSFKGTKFIMAEISDIPDADMSIHKVTIKDKNLPSVIMSTDQSLPDAVISTNQSLPDAVILSIKVKMIETKATTTSMPSSVAPVTTGTAPKKQNGFNLFVKANMKEMKSFCVTVDAWKGLTDEGRKLWNVKAVASNAAEANRTTSNAQTKLPISGWHCFVKAHAKQAKLNHPSFTSSEVMKSIACCWQNLSQCDKNEWHIKAKYTA